LECSREAKDILQGSGHGCHGATKQATGKVENPIARGAQIVAGDLAENGHCVAVVESAAGSKRDECGNQKGMRVCVSEQEQKRTRQQHAAGLRVKAAADSSRAPSICKPSSENDSREAGGLDLEGRCEPGGREIHLKTLIQVKREPSVDEPVGDCDGGKDDGHGGEARQPEQFANRSRETTRRRRLLGLDIRLCAEEKLDDHEVDDASRAQAQERRSPAVVLAGPAAGGAAENHSDVKAALVQAYSERSRPRSVMLGNLCERRGQIAGLADSHQGADDKHLRECARETGEQRDRAPDEETAAD
jgi:hypothetical protein